MERLPSNNCYQEYPYVIIWFAINKQYKYEVFVYVALIMLSHRFVYWNSWIRVPEFKKLNPEFGFQNSFFYLCI